MKATTLSSSHSSVDQRSTDDTPFDDPPGREVTIYEVTLRDGTMERIEEADAYQQEGPMTTFFRTAPQRRVVDTWSTRMASFRTSEIMIVRRRGGGRERCTVRRG